MDKSQDMIVADDQDQDDHQDSNEQKNGATDSSSHEKNQVSDKS